MWVLILLILVVLVILFYIISRNNKNSDSSLSEDVSDVIQGDDPLESDTDKSLDCVGSFYSDGKNPNVLCKNLLDLSKETYKDDISGLRSKHPNVTVPNLKDYMDKSLDKIVKYSYLKTEDKRFADPGFMVDYPLNDVDDSYLRYILAMYNFHVVLSNFYQKLYIMNCSPSTEYKNMRDVIQTLPLGSRADGINYPGFYSEKLNSVDISNKLQTSNYVDRTSRTETMLYDYLRFQDKMINSDPLTYFLSETKSPKIEDWGETVLSKDEVCAFLYGMMIYHLNVGKGKYFELHSRLKF